MKNDAKFIFENGELVLKGSNLDAIDFTTESKLFREACKNTDFTKACLEYYEREKKRVLEQRATETKKPFLML